MISYNIVAELATKMSVQHAEQLLDNFADYHPAVAKAGAGTELILSLPADSLAQAATTGLALLRATGHRLVRLEVLSSDDYDRRADLPVLPELLSVTEVAERLHVSRQAVLQRIDSGSLPSIKVGTTHVIPAAAVRALIA